MAFVTEDNRYTTQVDAFLGAQHEWMPHNLRKKAIILQTDESGTPKLPPKAIPVHGKAGKGTFTGHYIDGRDGAIETISYRMPDPASLPRGARPHPARSNSEGALAPAVCVAGPFSALGSTPDHAPHSASSACH
jgi:ParB family transcriptional regulator, chromosome partitioning protein